MEMFLHLLRGGGLLTLVGAGGLLLQVVALVFSFRAARAKGSAPPGPVSQLIMAVLILAPPGALLAVGYVMVQARWETVVAASLEPESIKELMSVIRLDSLQVCLLTSTLFLVQVLVGAPAAGLMLAARSRALAAGRTAEEDHHGLTPRGGALGAFVVALVTALPFCGGVFLFAASWQNGFSSLSGADPAMRNEMLLQAAKLPHQVLDAAAVIAACGLLVSALCVAVSILRRRAALRRGSPRGRLFTSVFVLGCLALSALLVNASRAYRLGNGRIPTAGHVRRLIEGNGLPFDLVQRLEDKPGMLRDLGTNNFSMSEDFWLPISKTDRRCGLTAEVSVTRNALLVENTVVANIKQGEVDSSVKRDGQSGYLITPLHDADSLVPLQVVVKTLDLLRGVGADKGACTSAACLFDRQVLSAGVVRNQDPAVIRNLVPGPPNPASKLQ